MLLILIYLIRNSKIENTMDAIPPPPQSQLTSSGHNKTFQNQIEIEPTVTSMRECRICLEASPCACAGSLQYVHENCLSSWITKQYQKQQIRQQIQNGYSPICQICKHAYNCQIQIQRKCATGQIVIQKIKENIPLFIALIFIIILMMFLLFESCQKAYSFKNESDDEFTKFQQFYIITAVIISVLGLIFAISKFVQLFLQYQDLKLTFTQNKNSQNRHQEPIQPQVVQQSQNGFIIQRPIS